MAPIEDTNQRPRRSSQVSWAGPNSGKRGSKGKGSKKLVTTGGGGGPVGGGGETRKGSD